MRAHWRKEIDWGEGTALEKKYQEALGDDWRETIRQRTAQLYAENPNCGTCKQAIPDVSTAVLWEPTNGPAFLVCTRGECQLKALRQSVDRYLSRARRVS